MSSMPFIIVISSMLLTGEITANDPKATVSNLAIEIVHAVQVQCTCRHVILDTRLYIYVI